MIQASGPVPGTISVTAAGTSSDPGYISLDAGSGFIGLLASIFRVEDDASLSTMLGEIGIEGNTLAGGTTKTIQFFRAGRRDIVQRPKPHQCPRGKPGRQRKRQPGWRFHDVWFCPGR